MNRSSRIKCGPASGKAVGSSLQSSSSASAGDSFHTETDQKYANLSLIGGRLDENSLFATKNLSHVSQNGSTQTTASLRPIVGSQGQVDKRETRSSSPIPYVFYYRELGNEIETTTQVNGYVAHSSEHSTRKFEHGYNRNKPIHANTSQPIYQHKPVNETISSKHLLDEIFGELELAEFSTTEKPDGHFQWTVLKVTCFVVFCVSVVLLILLMLLRWRLVKRSWSKMAQANEQECYLKIVGSFEQLSQTLLTLDQLPLSIVGVKCTSAYYRKTKPFPPHGIAVGDNQKCPGLHGAISINKRENSPLFVPSLKVLVSLERSSKWGNDLNVINKLKTGFYVEIASRLESSKPSWYSVPTEKQLFIVVSGIVYSVKVVHQREIELVVQYEKMAPLTNTVYSKGKSSSSVVLRKNLILKPLISQQLNGISKRFASFSETCKLVRKWLCWNFMSKMIEGLAIELMVAHIFVDPNAGPLPTNGLAGFVKFLSLLSTHDFVAKPLLVDMNSSFNEEITQQVMEDFLKRRPTLPPIVLIVPEDTVGSAFTSAKPEPLILKHLIKLASVAHKSICQTLSTTGYLSAYQMPSHDVSIYDICIRIHGCYVVTNDESSHRGKKKRGKVLANTEKLRGRKFKLGQNVVKKQSSYEHFPVVDYDPVKRFVLELRNNYDSVALFFYNKYKSYAIGVMLRPSFVQQSRDSKVITGCHLRFKDPNDGALKADVNALVEDFKILGGRMVRDVIVSKKVNPKEEDESLEIREVCKSS
uniref:Nucleolar protein 6 n=1 Tax=Ditylenchus dipsaci TaxID=166011 RepID=A0A915DF97_9BILA